MAKLINQSGGEPREIPLSEVCRIGRDEGNEFVLADAGASRRHCRLSREGDGYVLEDLKSANGTFRNDERIDRVRLADGDRIRIGATELLFSAEAATSGDELSAETAATGAFELIFTRGEHAHERVRMAGPRLTFGRRSSNTVIFKDPKVSGVHAELVLEDGRPVVRDLGSTNGTFLEGKRIDEIVLHHGDRVALGDSEFVLADVSRGEPSLDESPADDASQTMVNMPTLRVVPHEGKVGRRSPLALIGLLVLLVAIGAAGWFYWTVRSKSRETAVALPAHGNLLGERWSFELVEDGPGPIAAWDFGGGERSLAAFDLTTNAPRSGQQALAARPNGGEAVAVLRDALKVSGRGYRVSGYVRVSGEAVATLAALFLRAEDDEYRVIVEVGSSAVTGWQEVGAEVVPPTGATQLALVLTAAGNSGEVVFDDLSVEEAGLQRVAVTAINQFEFERAGENLLVRRGNELLRIGGLTFEAPEATAHAVDQYLHDGAVVLSRGGRATYGAALATDAKSATWCVEWQSRADQVAGVVLPIVLLPALTAEPVGVVRSGVREPYLESFEADDVSGLVLGVGTTRMRLSFQPAVRVVGTRAGEFERLAVRPPLLSGSLAVRMQVDFVEEKTKAVELAAAAAEAQRQNRLGEALTIVNRITNEFPFDEGILATADARAREIVRERERLEARLQEAMKRARFLSSPAAYLEAEEEARAGAAAFVRTPAADFFRQSEVELANEREALIQSGREREAELLYRRVETALAQLPARERVAREIARFLTEWFPGSEPARKAKEKIEEL